MKTLRKCEEDREIRRRFAEILQRICRKSADDLQKFHKSFRTKSWQKAGRAAGKSLKRGGNLQDMIEEYGRSENNDDV